MKKISRLFAGSIALSILSMVQAQAQNASSSSHAAQETAFLAAIPADPDTPGQPEINAEVADLANFNPGKGDVIRPIVVRKVACQAQTVHAAARHAMQEAAHALPGDTLGRLTAFYSGPDYRRLDGIKNKTAPTQAEQDEAQAILARYKAPMDALFAESDKTMRAAADNPEFQNAMKACEDVQTAAFAQTQIKSGE